MRNALNETTVCETLKAIHELRELVVVVPVRVVAVWTDQPLGTMHGWLVRLRDRGLVTWESGRKRSLRLTPAGRRHIGLPKVIRLSDFGPNPEIRLYG